MTIHWEAVELYFTVMLFVVHFFPVCNFGKMIDFGLRTVNSEITRVMCLLSISFVAGHCHVCL